MKRDIGPSTPRSRWALVPPENCGHGSLGPAGPWSPGTLVTRDLGHQSTEMPRSIHTQGYLILQGPGPRVDQAAKGLKSPMRPSDRRDQGTLRPRVAWSRADQGTKGPQGSRDLGKRGPWIPKVARDRGSPTRKAPRFPGTKVSSQPNNRGLKSSSNARTARDRGTERTRKSGELNHRSQGIMEHRSLWNIGTKGHREMRRIDGQRSRRAGTNDPGDQGAEGT